MPRQPRIDLPGHLYHIIIRGIEKRNIFQNTQDYQEFIKRFGELLIECKAIAYAWCLMPNHAHLLVRSGNKGLAQMMRRLLIGFGAGDAHESKGRT